MGISRYSQRDQVRARSRYPIHLSGKSRASTRISLPGSCSRRHLRGLRKTNGASPRDSLPHPAQGRPRLPRHPIRRNDCWTPKRPRRRLRTNRATGAELRTQCVQMRIGPSQRSLPSPVISNAGRKQDTPNPPWPELLHEPNGPKQEHQRGRDAMLSRPELVRLGRGQIPQPILPSPQRICLGL